LKNEKIGPKDRGEKMLRVHEISKSYGSDKAVDRVSFTLKPGTITIMAGADGAGKSTILKIILGLVKKNAGTIYLDGKPVGKHFDRITAVTGYMPERFSLYTDLSVEENLNFYSDIRRVPRLRRDEMKNRLLDKTGMLPFRKRRAGALSGGMKQKLALSSILLASPDIIILDEPTTGVDPLSRIEFFNILQELKGEGKTVIMATPYLDEAEKGDEVIFIKDGKILREGSISSLKEEFPAKLFRILPSGNILEIIQILQEDPAVKDDVYVRGRFIKFLQREGRVFPEHIPVREIHEEPPTLEDIYLYHERIGHAPERMG
jgi:ABC-2 type transport system ATP-binding protein